MKRKVPSVSKLFINFAVQMNSTQDIRRYKSAYRYSAELGPIMGVLLFCISASLIASVKIPLFGSFIFLFVIAVPIVLFSLMRHIWIRASHLRTLGAMWLSGIWIFIFGALICALLSALTILIFVPDFILLYLQQAVQAIEQSSLAPAYASELQTMRSLLQSGAVPSPMQFIVSMIWTTAFAGSILSLICAVAVKTRYSRRFPLTL